MKQTVWFHDIYISIYNYVDDLLVIVGNEKGVSMPVRDRRAFILVGSLFNGVQRPFGQWYGSIQR